MTPPIPNDPGSRLVDRRTLLVGAAGVLVAAGLGQSARAGGHATLLTPLRQPHFDPVLARRLQQVLDHAVAGSSSGRIPGAILHVERAGHGSWTGTSGLGRLHPEVAMRPGDRFRAGSIAKPFVATTVLQLVERGRFTLDAALPSVLPAEVTDRFPSAAKITVRMLLDHRSGLPEWSTPATDAAAARTPIGSGRCPSSSLSPQLRNLPSRRGHATRTRTPTTRSSA